MDEQVLKVALGCAVYGQDYREYLAILEEYNSSRSPVFLDFVLRKLGNTGNPCSTLSEEEYNNLRRVAWLVLDTRGFILSEGWIAQLQERAKGLDSTGLKVMELTIRFFFSDQYAELIVREVLVTK